MSSFTITWNESSPAGTDYANQLDTFIQQFKVAVRERLNLEHYPFGNTYPIEHMQAAGRHYPGKVGVVGTGTSADRTALSGMGKGSLY